MFFVNCVFENDMFLLFLRIYDVMKVIVITCFSLIAYLKMTCFYYFLRIRNNCDDMFFVNCVFENDISCIFYNLVFINPTIKIITIISPFTKYLFFLFLIIFSITYTSEVFLVFCNSFS